VRQLTKAGCKKVFREVVSGAKTDRDQLRRLLDTLAPGDVVTVTRLDRLARSTRDLLNTLATIKGLRILANPYFYPFEALGKNSLLQTRTFYLLPTRSRRAAHAQRQ
jgi:hypothetical protein